MCRWCVEYGNGNKWYLNPENYKEELYKAHGDVVQRFAGVAKNTVELGIGGPGMDDILEDRNDMSMFSMFAESHHAGQVMPIEDALEVLDLTGDRFLLMHCSCRRYMGHEDAIKCLWFEPGVDIALEERPWETESLVINREEAKEFLLQKDKEGSVQIIYDYGTFGDAKLPMSICNCVYPECASIRIRENLGGHPSQIGVCRGHRQTEVHWMQWEAVVLAPVPVGSPAVLTDRAGHVRGERQVLRLWQVPQRLPTECHRPQGPAGDSVARRLLVVGVARHRPN